MSAPPLPVVKEERPEIRAKSSPNPLPLPLPQCSAFLGDCRPDKGKRCRRLAARITFNEAAAAADSDIADAGLNVVMSYAARIDECCKTAGTRRSKISRGFGSILPAFIPRRTVSYRLVPCRTVYCRVVL